MPRECPLAGEAAGRKKRDLVAVLPRGKSIVQNRGREVAAREQRTPSEVERVQFELMPSRDGERLRPQRVLTEQRRELVVPKAWLVGRVIK